MDKFPEGVSFIGNPSSAGGQLGGLEPPSGIHRPTVPGLQTRDAARCNICGGWCRLERDHDHVTGFIRGWLCRSCNAFLWVYETREDHPKRGSKSKKFRLWLSQHRVQIEAHLKCNTGILYQCPSL